MVDRSIERKKRTRLAYSFGEIEERYPIHRVTLRRLIEKGEMRGFRIGAKWMIPTDEVRRVFGALPDTKK